MPAGGAERCPGGKGEGAACGAGQQRTCDPQEQVLPYQAAAQQHQMGTDGCQGDSLLCLQANGYKDNTAICWELNNQMADLRPSVTSLSHLIVNPFFSTTPPPAPLHGPCLRKFTLVFVHWIGG